MASKNIVEIIIKATDKASKQMKGLTGIMGKLGVAAGVAGVAVAAMGVAAGVAIFKMTKEAASVEKLSKTFDSLAVSIGENSDLMIKDLRVASRGMLNDADLMQASNKLVAMGLAETSEESAKLVEMSTQLGSAMGMNATDSAEAFALMLANQSIPRLDNFGISSGVVRDRILELMEANQGMTRETAFMTATMEEGAKTMEKVGEQGEGAAANMARLEANVANLKHEIGLRFLPILESLTDKLLVMWDDPKIQASIDTLFIWIEAVADSIVEIVNYLSEGNVEAAFNVAFGEGAYSSVMKVVGAIDSLSDSWNNFYSGFVSRNNAVTRWIHATQDRVHNLMALVGIQTERQRYPLMQATGGRGARASGGPVSSGGSYLVGEEGPEILNMGGSSGYITPNHKLGGTTVVFNFHSVVSLADMANAERVMLPIVEKGLRTVMAR